MKVTFKIFRGVFESWDEIFSEASEFASSLEKDHLINISHSAAGADGFVSGLRIARQGPASPCHIRRGRQSSS